MKLQKIRTYLIERGENFAIKADVVKCCSR